jgi:hypothetical protein
MLASIERNLDLLPEVKAAIDEMVLQTRFERLKQPLLRPDADEATETL